MSQLLGTNKSLKILDIGTGNGFLALLLAEMGYDVTGVDWAKSKIQKAKDKAAALKIKVNFKVQDAKTLSFPGNTFDAVVIRHVIWTLADPLTAARDWTRVVRFQGKVIADIPHMRSHSGSHHFGDEVVRMFKQAGLTEVDLLTIGAKFFPGVFETNWF